MQNNSVSPGGSCIFLASGTCLLTWTALDEQLGTLSSVSRAARTPLDEITSTNPRTAAATSQQEQTAHALEEVIQKRCLEAVHALSTPRHPQPPLPPLFLVLSHAIFRVPGTCLLTWPALDKESGPLSSVSSDAGTPLDTITSTTSQTAAATSRRELTSHTLEEVIQSRCLEAVRVLFLLLMNCLTDSVKI